MAGWMAEIGVARLPLIGVERHGRVQRNSRRRVIGNDRGGKQAEKQQAHENDPPATISASQCISRQVHALPLMINPPNSGLNGDPKAIIQSHGSEKKFSRIPHVTHGYPRIFGPSMGDQPLTKYFTFLLVAPRREREILGFSRQRARSALPPPAAAARRRRAASSAARRESRGR